MRGDAMITLHTANDISILTVAGELDDESASRLDLLLRRARAEAVIDMSGVTRADTEGLAPLLEAYRRGCTLYLRAPSPAARRAIERAGVGALFVVRPDLS